MDALKLRRTPLRTAFTKAVNHLQEIIENDPVDMNAVETAFEQLKVKSAKLKEVEDAVLELMIESNCTQEAYNIEFEAIEGYAEKMIAWQVRVKNIMKADALGQKHNHSLVTSSSSSLRLPKIQFQQFSGESDVKCIICNKRHYAVLCSKLPLRSGLETESASVENSTTASSSSSNIAVIIWGKIEILIGADVAGKLLTGTMFYLKSGPVAIKTKLGWTLMGKTYRNKTNFDNNHFMNVTSMFVNDMCISDLWNLKDDCLSCKINCQKIEGKAITTKRSLLSIANPIFDPIGFTAPVTLKPKLILQEIWKLKLKWDENLPENILNQVKQWLEQLPILAGIKIPRCLNLSSNGIKQIALHVFCGASKKAYAACVFLRVEYEENVFVKLIQAKARVAPLKDISIPRLELLSCTLGTRLAASVKND
ncbi:integrase catalytic domain-containing protein [Trichonephila inaurata madagascariensis]|uniref:Integrase catalytic domain-containing protein n=1 Tax=Trichonephila inaurata madagascariensis TaxID=2747483 RepID=A0A8X7CR83_9ARAC|nr:integrase catalytic domain-containing protein [Trichonephila inaurata madagascariensis]